MPIASPRERDTRLLDADRLGRLNAAMASFGSDPLANIEVLLALCGKSLGATVMLFNRREAEQLVTVAGWNLPDDYATTVPAEGTLTAMVMASPDHDATLVCNLQNGNTADPHALRYPPETYLG